MKLFRYALAVAVGVMWSACAFAGWLIPSEASGVYDGAGWRCAVTAALVPSPVGTQPSVSFSCEAPTAFSLIGFGQRQQYTYECPRATEQTDATAASLWPDAPPWTIPVGIVVVRDYAPGTPAVLVVDIAGPGQPPARVALGRTQILPVPPSVAYGCTAAGKVIIGPRKQDR